MAHGGYNWMLRNNDTYKYGYISRLYSENRYFLNTKWQLWFFINFIDIKFKLHILLERIIRLSNKFAM